MEPAPAAPPGSDGAPAEQRICPSCGEQNPASGRLCGRCGTSLVRDEAAGEIRRLITLVTSDLKGSTALGERLDPEALREVLNRYFSVMRAVFEAHGGTIEKIIGDAIVAVFGLPFRHDDDPIRALEAAAESQRALATLNEELEQGWGVRLVNRTGVATGEVTFGKADPGQHVLLGPPVELSGLMEQNAPPLEVLVADSTYDLVRDLVEAEPVPPVSPKGSTEQVPAHRLVSVLARDVHAQTEAPEAAPGLRICPSCGEQSPERMRYCVFCGASLADVTVRESRRTVTIVFAMPRSRVEGGTSPNEDAQRDVISRYFDAMRVALERHGGTVEKFIGDAVMAVFGLPFRHEDDALRAIRAAADMQAALPGLNAVSREAWGIELENHIGVNTGEVIAGDASTGQRLVTGDAVNTAARLEQAAGAGEIVLGDLTYRLARDEIEIEFIPPLTLKGKAEPVPAYRLVTIGKPASTGESGTPFVGREAELARLSSALLDAADRRRARIVTVVGDAGVGKSRLIREFAAEAAQQARVVRGRCLPYGDGITFWPLAEVVRDAAGILAEDSPDVAIGKIRALLDARHRDRDQIVDRIAAAMNLTTAQFPVPELLWGGRRLLEMLAAERPVTMIVDDIHSAETTFLEFLDHVIDAVEGAPILLLCSARDELAERHPDWLTAHETDTIRLEPLTETESGRIVEELLGDLEPSLRARIADASEGNPLYVEQIVSMLVETGALERGMDGWVARAGADTLQIPPTVQALVASRLDSLGAEERGVVDPASVIGLSFPEDAVEQLVEEPLRDRLQLELETLETKQLVKRAPGDELIYRFGHQVIRDTAYGSLLKRVRAALHEAFVAWAERVNRERGRETEFEEILGYHLEQAYRYRTDLGVIDMHARSIADRAAEKLGSAGRRAFLRSDLPAATSLLARAVALMQESDPNRVELLLELTEALFELGRAAEAVARSDDATTTAKALGDERLIARVRATRLTLDLFTQDPPPAPEESVAAANELMPIFERFGDEAGLARAWRLLIIVYGTAGRLAEAAAAATQTVEHASRAGDFRMLGRAATGYATAALHGPVPNADVAQACQALLGQVRNDRKAEAVILGVMAQIEAMNGDFEQARATADRGRRLLTDLGPSITAFSTSTEAFRIEVLADDLPAAERLLREDDMNLEALGERYFRSSILALLGNVVAMEERFEEAAKLVSAAGAIADLDDVLTRILIDGASSRVAAAGGRLDEALDLASRAVRAAAGTEDPITRADAESWLGELCERTGRLEDGRGHLRAALDLYGAKGDRISAARVQEMLTAEPVAAAPRSGPGA